MDTPSVDIPRFSYDVTMPDIGKGYAEGIETAGKGIAAGVTTGLHDYLTLSQQNRDADDTLSAMNKTGILSDDAYKAVAGKSLGAKQSMLGLYSGQWIAQMAQQRDMQKMGYGANLDIYKQHQALLDEISKLKATRPQVLPMNTGQQAPAPQAQPPGNVALQGKLPIGKQNLTVTGAPGTLSPTGAPVQSTTPLASGDITRPTGTSPQYPIGKPWTGTMPATYISGSLPIKGVSTPGILVPDATVPGGWSFRPRGT